MINSKILQAEVEAATSGDLGKADVTLSRKVCQMIIDDESLYFLYFR